MYLASKTNGVCGHFASIFILTYFDSLLAHVAITRARRIIVKHLKIKIFDIKGLLQFGKPIKWLWLLKNNKDYMFPKYTMDLVHKNKLAVAKYLKT